MHTNVHVWQIDLDNHPIPPENLSPAEQARAAQMRHPQARARFVAGRAALRAILARYLAIDPAEVNITTNAAGKPLLVDGSLQFNLAHSGSRALLAIAREHPIGIDLERIRPLPDAAGLAARIFSPAEQVAFAALPEADQLRAIFAAWTRKEAVAKARGEGLLLPPDRIEVSIQPGQPPRLLRLIGLVEHWTLCDLNVGPDYAGALAVAGPVAGANSFFTRDESADCPTNASIIVTAVNM